MNVLIEFGTYLNEGTVPAMAIVWYSCAFDSENESNNPHFCRARLITILVQESYDYPAARKRSLFTRN